MNHTPHRGDFKRGVLPQNGPARRSGHGRRVARLADIFRLKGYAGDIGQSAAEAVKKSAARHFDNILSDIKMPHINGVERYRTITGTCPNLPVVLMTGYAADTLVSQGLHEGMIGVASKPLNIEKLLTFFASLRQECLVVIINDNLKLSHTLVEMLSEQHFSIVPITCSSSAFGFDDLRMKTSVVLLNVTKHSQKGFDILRAIRQHHTTIPVILLMDDCQDLSPDTQHAITRGASACLEKPFDPTRLSRFLAQLHHRHIARSLEQKIY